MTESPLVNEWIQRAADRKGLKQGREWLLDVLQARFPAELTSEVIDAINQQPSLALLSSWRHAAVFATTFEDFLAVMRPAQPLS